MDKKNRIREICELLQQSVTSTPDSFSIYLLSRLWEHSIGLYHQSLGLPVPSYSPISPFWKLIGFQRETPLTDFRGGGIISLIHLIVFVERFPLFVLGLMQDPDELKFVLIKLMITRLPLAIACINLSILLVKALGLYSIETTSEVSFLSTKPVWSLASQPSFLNEVSEWNKRYDI